MKPSTHLHVDHTKTCPHSPSELRRSQVVVVIPPLVSQSAVDQVRVVVVHRRFFRGRQRTFALRGCHGAVCHLLEAAALRFGDSGRARSSECF